MQWTTGAPRPRLPASLRAPPALQESRALFPLNYSPIWNQSSELKLVRKLCCLGGRGLCAKLGDPQLQKRVQPEHGSRQNEKRCHGKSPVKGRNEQAKIQFQTPSIDAAFTTQRSIGASANIHLVNFPLRRLSRGHGSAYSLSSARMSAASVLPADARRRSSSKSSFSAASSTS